MKDQWFQQFLFYTIYTRTTVSRLLIEVPSLNFTIIGEDYIIMIDRYSFYVGI